MIRQWTFALVMMLGLNSCYYDVEETLYPSSSCESTNLSYSDDIIPILVSQCYGCHDTRTNFGQVTLEGHDELLKTVNDGRLIGAITHSSGYSAMPQGRSKMSDCQVEKIQSWIGDGAPNN